MSCPGIRKGVKRAFERTVRKRSKPQNARLYRKVLLPVNKIGNVYDVIASFRTLGFNDSNAAHAYSVTSSAHNGMR